MTEEHGYRDAKIKPYCSQCGKIAVGVCVRCDQPLCEADLHAEDKRCGTCEAEQDRRSRKRGYATYLLFGFMVLQLVLTPFLGTNVALVGAVMSAFVAMAIGVTAVADWRASRSRFLRERFRREKGAPSPEVRRYCARCGKETHRTCPSCDKPYCAEHIQGCDCQHCPRCGVQQHRVLGVNERCKQCETAYRDGHAMLQPAAALFWLFALSLVALAMRPEASLQNSLVLALLIGLGGMSVLGLLRLLGRRRFLRERKRR